MSEAIKGWLCSKCGPLHYDEVDAVDQTIGCTRCGGVMWSDDDITISPLYTTDHAEELAKALEYVVASSCLNNEVADGAIKAITNYREATK
jgi:hypothetical protein